MKADRLIVEKLAELFGAMGHPHRVGMLMLLRDGERCVCDIAAALGMQQPNTSQHLGMLRRAGFVVCRKEGLQTFYQLASPRVPELLDLALDILRERSALDRETWVKSAGTAARLFERSVEEGKTDG